LAVRVHKTLELADDRFYVLTCGKGYTKDENSQILLKFFDKGLRVRELAYGREYQVKAEVNQTAVTQEFSGIKVKSCFAFNKKNASRQLLDERGCSVDGIMARFKSTEGELSATSIITSMFKFPDGAETHIQCDITYCKDKCPEDEKCSEESAKFVKGGRALGQPEEGLMLAGTTVFVLDPSEVPQVSPICDGSEIRPAWLLWLTIVLGILFLIMLLMNLFLCTAMSCSCAKTEVSFSISGDREKCNSISLIYRLSRRNHQ